MAVIIPNSNVGYLRIDGLRVNLCADRQTSLVYVDPANPTTDTSVEIVKWFVPPERPVTVHVYGYASAAARSAGDAPLSSEDRSWTLGQLGLDGSGATTAALWAAIYAALKQDYPNASDDMLERAP